MGNEKQILSISSTDNSTCVVDIPNTSLRSLVKYFFILEEKFRIYARPCNILQIHVSVGESRGYLSISCVPKGAVLTIERKTTNLFNTEQHMNPGIFGKNMESHTFLMYPYFFWS